MVGGFSYPAVARLFRTASAHWRTIDGACAKLGVDPTRLRFDRFLNLIYSLIVENQGEEELLKIQRELFAPATGVDPDMVSPEVVADEMAGFNALLGGV